MVEAISNKLDRLVQAFEKVLFEEDDIFMQNMVKMGYDSQNLHKYRYWEWTQGVGLYGLWKRYLHSGKEEELRFLTDFYDARLEEGLPGKNVNTAAPMLTLAYLYEETGCQAYLDVCIEWADWIMIDFPRTEEGGFQHITSDSINEQELWDDTLFMTVLFLAKIGDMTLNQAYMDEAAYQFLIHIKYLADPKTGLWYHGWTFNGKNNFAGAFWGRGNAWITIAIPELLGMLDLDEASRVFILEAYYRQVEALVEYQAESGMWHTLLDDASSYLESSATCGIAAGIAMGIRMNLLDDKYLEVVDKAIGPILELVGDDGVLDQVSYGTAMGRDGLDFYRDIPIRPMPYGQALAIIFLVEMLGLYTVNGNICIGEVADEHNQ